VAKAYIGGYHPEHLAAEGTPKKKELLLMLCATVGQEKATVVYEQMMFESFAEANRVLKSMSDGRGIRHKTTLDGNTCRCYAKGWFVVTEAWPLDTREAEGFARWNQPPVLQHLPCRRKREGSLTGSYEDGVRAELERSSASAWIRSGR